MIVVIADDLSGAAELAGAATRLGFSAEVQTRFTPGVPSAVVSVDSGDRMLSPSAAAEGMERMIRVVLAAAPDWIYLKFDSVLRGNILAELSSALRVTGLERALLVTANPGRGRIIRRGEYLIDGVPLHETSFAADPEYPRTTASVRELLGEPAAGILPPDVEDPRDLAALASGAGPDTLTAGSAEFFEALLLAGAAPYSAGRGRPPQAPPEPPYNTDGGRSSRDAPETPPATSGKRPPQAPGDALSNAGEKRPRPAPPEAPPSAAGRQHSRGGARRADPDAERSSTLLVCGSLGAWRTRSDEARDRRIQAFDIHDDPAAAARSFADRGTVLLGIGDRPETRSIPPQELLATLAEVAANVTRAVAPGRLLLEGGATAAAVVRRLGWTRMISLEGVGEGVGTLKPEGTGTPIVLIKPGSYPWPVGVW